MIYRIGYKDCYAELGNVVIKIVNLSVELGRVPSAWRTAVITPVPKCTPYARSGYLRLILSQMVERLLVKDHIILVISS